MTESSGNCCNSGDKLQSYNLGFKNRFVYSPAETLAGYFNMTSGNTRNLWWYSNYAMNNLPMVVMKSFDVFPALKSLIFPLNHVMGGLTHMLMGANPRCQYDQALYTAKPLYYHGLNFLTGLFNCFLVALSSSYLRPALSAYMGEGAATVATGVINLAGVAFLEGKNMCSIEQAVLNGYPRAEKLVGTAVNDAVNTLHSWVNYVRSGATESAKAK